ncbi:N-acetylmuramoyl-L-alanine amidase family protein [Methylococcus capsulatus]|uniref:N-acetylmuramoyl-L-alanine amidase family protein n=1 Tax=Methylococcus capsulatus TaxID=414 RepID=UPI001C532DE3|nr:N-acetylmuramoyl-L-alanine amidase [Methylococcus capsulatus]QXP87987.1 N-acetylmuramoyl-L-alanine amidase [Methylococcus capsulatus]QXP95000.1 N-acetylmuramoyl-L-alanine amidase [Methylococcus capsulatus]UQN13011.1 N-acetylmuramoyl-L-alanine amidase [Methylococcus capsulatus]
MRHPFPAAFLFALLMLLSPAGWADPAAKATVSLKSGANVTRLLLTVPKGASLKPQAGRADQLIVAMEGVEALPGLPNPAGDRHVAALHTRSKANGRLDLIVELRPAAEYRTLLSVTDAGNPSLTVDVTAARATASRPPQAPVAKAADGPHRKRFVVALDAGHGGKDTGALGAGGSQEKDIVLAIARKLEALLNAEPGIRPVMIRQNDEFIDLRQRMERARKEHADLFVSLHADAYNDPHAKGASVFTLSEHGATSEAARRLADRENAADRIGGVALQDKDEVLASVLLDLTQNATLEASDRAAASILQALQKSHAIHQPGIQKAGFVVLKSPDVPSVLVETAFISNPEEELKLRSPAYQDQIAAALAEGIRSYLKRTRPATVAPISPPVRQEVAASVTDKVVK